MNRNVSWQDEYNEDYFEQESEVAFFDQHARKRDRQLKREHEFGRPDQKRTKKKRFIYY